MATLQEEMERAYIWYSPASREWWMEPYDQAVKRCWLLTHEDAIHVTNAYEQLPEPFILKLKARAGR